VSVCSVEDVAAFTRRPFWFQLYMMRDRDFIERLIERAKAAGCLALVLTLDLPVMGQRHKDIRNGLSAPPRPTLANVLNMMTKPRWCLAQARTRRHGFGNIIGHVQGISDKTSLAAWTVEQFDASLDWDDVRWVQRQWGGPLVLKGLLDGDDARRAIDCGANAIVVSNHGGRQLDGAPSSISVLPEMVAAVDDRCEVWFDSGVRSGQDVLKALALGAHAALIGRAYVYGLGALGEAGVTRTLELIKRELELTMTLCGVRDIAGLDRHVLQRGSYPIAPC
ncbi:MAG: alpha-hydroxy acid oxidase, partial [Dokdonella sp.]